MVLCMDVCWRAISSDGRGEMVSCSWFSAGCMQMRISENVCDRSRAGFRGK